MFKIESYVTPILLSYVDKYVRDFKPADAQVSLWGGGVALHNLVLKADVLQQEVALPFTLVSGRIHELLIQVPWTKIMSEPIVVTIDTIECVLSLHPRAPSDESLPPESPSRKPQVVEAPPGYMQALVRRIVSNISLRVHHLIVKYVQDDIVLSLNVKHLSVESAGLDWQPAFADIDQAEPVIRRLVRLDDLTLCLDRADSDGKIRFYQEPLLYRCQLDLRVLTRLVSANTRRASSLSVQLRSSKLAWGVTSEQLTLLLRLLRERAQIQITTPPPAPKQSATNLTTPLHATSCNSAEPVRSESWSEWAWSWLPTWMDKEGGVEEATLPPTPIPVFFTAYFDHVSLVFKVLEIESGSRKRARGVLELSAAHAAARAAVCAPTALRVRFGARTLRLASHGKCVCGMQNLEAINDRPTIYIDKKNAEDEKEPWTWPAETLEYKVELAEAAEEECSESPNRGEFAPVTEVLEQNIEGTCGGAKDAERKDDEDLWQLMSPVIYLEYSHVRSPPNVITNPYDSPPIDFQYSDWEEDNNLKISIQPLDIRFCMGLIHRLSAVKTIFHDLPPVPVPDIPMRTLTVEECEALYENLPQRRININVQGLRVRMLPWDHSLTEKPTLAPLVLDIEVPQARLIVSLPLYPHRVCSAACQMPKDEGPLWQGARLHVSATLSSIEARLCSPGDSPPRSVARADLRAVLHVLLHPEMFARRDTVKKSYSFKIHELNICGSAARLQAAWQVVGSLITRRPSLLLRYTELAKDALFDEESVAIDATLEDLSVRGFITRRINTHIVMVQSARVMAFHSPREGKLKQAWLFSAPDISTSTSFLRVAMQWCEEQFEDSLEYIGVWSEPIAACVDPLLIAWLGYKPNMKVTTESLMGSKSSSQLYFRRRATPPSSSGRGASRTGSGSELVHAVRPRSGGSSSEPGEPPAAAPPQPSAPRESILLPERMLQLHERLQRMLVNVELGMALLYFTSSSASAVDCATLRDAMERHATMERHVLAFSVGKVTFSSNVMMKYLWNDIRHDGPTLRTQPPEENRPASEEKMDSFPWKLRLGDVSCYTLKAREIVDTGCERATGLRSHLKMSSSAVKMRTVLEPVTTTVTLSVVTKTMQIRSWIKPQQDQKVAGRTPDETRMKYFTAGVDFKPSTLKEFVRGPAKRRKPSVEPQTQESKNEPTETTIKGPVVSIGVHLHADTPPVTVRLEQDQVHTVAAAVHCLRHLHILMHRAPLILPRQHSSLDSSRRSLIRSVSELDEQQTPSDENLSETRSELVPIFESYGFPEVKLKKFFWFQWVVGRATLVIASDHVKLAFEVDDIISTIDLQEHYNQLKVKVASASVRHHKKNSNDEWSAGVLGGRVLEAREPTEAIEENHFLAVTITQAQISTLPESWKEELNPKLLENKSGLDSMWEIYATLAPLEAVLQPDVLENILSLYQEMAPPSFCPLQSETQQRSSSWQWPFCYVSAGGMRLMVTTEHKEKSDEDTFLFIVGKICVTPYPENPICRRAVTGGTDSGWAGSAGGLEGRQYEVYIKNVAIQSAHFNQIVQQEASVMRNSSGAGSENPAVKWTQPPVSPIVTPILHAVDFNCVIAPALYICGGLACGPALELNLASDCAVEISMKQIILAQHVVADAKKALSSSYESFSSLDNDIFGVCPYAPLVLRQKSTNENDAIASGPALHEEETTTPLGFDRSFAADSGVDINMSKSSRQLFDPTSMPKKSVSIAFLEETANASDYLEIFVTMGMIEMSLYVEDDNSPEIVALRPPSEASVATATTQDVEPTPKEERISLTYAEDLQETNTSKSHSRSLTDIHADIGHTKLDVNAELPHARKREGNLPLLHWTLYQPNLYYWKKKSQSNLQVSLFNAWIGFGAGVVHGFWGEAILSTAKGVPDPATDIPPALATVKIVVPSAGSTAYLASSTGGNKGTVAVDIERPVLLEVSGEKLKRLNLMIEMIKSHIKPVSTSTEPTDVGKIDELPVLFKLRKFMVQRSFESITIKASQVGLSGCEGTLGWDSASLQIAVGQRSERLTARAQVGALLAAAGPPGDSRHLLMQPLMLGLELESTCEAWRRVEGGASAQEPCVHLAIDLDRVTLDVRPEDLAALKSIKQTLEELYCKKPPPLSSESADSIFISQQQSTTYAFGRGVSASSLDSTEVEDHYYKDDLKSGAFKLVSGGQLPMAYQVMLYGDTVSWRYPHPRTITKITVNPVPDVNEEVNCVLELYNSLLRKWEPHTYIKLPVTEPREINIYVPPPDIVFAIMWRFRAHVENDKEEPPFEFQIDRFLPRDDPLTIARGDETAAASGDAVSAEQLWSALRVDSYFAPRLLPRMRVALRCTELELHLHNSLLNLSSHKTALEGYYVSRPLMRSHRVLSVVASDATAHALLGSPAGRLLLLDTKLSCDVLECSTGALEQAVGATRLRAALSAPGECAAATGRVRAFCDAMRVALHVPRLRTLRALADDWQLAIQKYKDDTSSLSEGDNDGIELLSRNTLMEATVAALEGRVSLWLHNSCSSALRVGQEATDELVPLGPGARLAYRWRSPAAPLKLRFALAGPAADWRWSTSLSLSSGACRIRLEDAEALGGVETPGGGVYLHARVATAGARRQLLLAGRLMLANALRRSLLYKVRARCADAKTWRSVCSGELDPESVGRSVLCGADCEMVLKIKFISQETGWSGDIPLKECPKENVPWLVKVPSEGETAYVSVWCRVVRARSDGRVLAAVWPLYVLYSHLPLDTDVLVTTETEVSTLELSPPAERPPPLVQPTPGRGACSHLLAPGTTAAKHQLSFQYKNIECPVTREAIPLHYGVTDTSVFDKRAPISNIDEVIEDIRAWFERSGRGVATNWPYSVVAGHWPGEWKAATLQPRSDVTVRYGAVRAGGGCSLEIRLCPVVLLCNAAPMPLTLRAHDAAPLCKVEPGAAISAPSAVLQKAFFMSVEIGRETFVSSQLQVWGEEPGRYGAPPRGCVALDHAAAFAIQCNNKVALLTLHYEIKEDINVLGMTPTFMLINRLKMDLMVSAIAVPVDSEKEAVLRPKSYKVVKPTKEGSLDGEPLTRFWLSGRWRGGEASELHAFLCLVLSAPAAVSATTSAGPLASEFACPPAPVALGRSPVRRAIHLTDENNKSTAVVVVQQKHEGRWVVTVAPDPCPQFVVHNRSSHALAIAEPVRHGDSQPTTQVLSECAGARWWCAVAAGAMAHYSTPAHCARFPPPPDARSPPALPFIAIGRATSYEVEPEWSAGVAAAGGEQLVQLAGGVTVKLRAHPHPHSTLLELQDVDQNDISASDIRRRLQGPFFSDANMITMGSETPTMRLARINADDTILQHSEDGNKRESVKKLSMAGSGPLKPAAESAVYPCVEPGASVGGEPQLLLEKNPEDYRPSVLPDLPKLFDNVPTHYYTGDVRQPFLYDSGNDNLPNPVAAGSPEPSFALQSVCDSEWGENNSWSTAERLRCVIGGIAIEMAATPDVKPLFALHIDRAAILLQSDNRGTKTVLSIADVQMDNLQYESGQYDFGVVASTRAAPLARDEWPPLWSAFAARGAFASRQDDARLLLRLRHDRWRIVSETFSELTEVELSVGPLALYVEDSYVAALAKLARSLAPSTPPADAAAAAALAEARALVRPLRLRSLHLHPLDLTLTLHTAVRMYIALDQSPLRLSAFQLEDMMTSTECLTHALTVHYLSAAILGAGWVVGGLELLGAPGALAARVGGATGGVRGVAAAAAAALLRSLSAWAGSLARNLDLLAGDEEHARRAAAARRRPPDSFMAGLAAGITNFAINILGAVGGLAHHPLVGVAVGETESGAAALRRGLVGALAKPLSATADLLALAGTGLLRQTGWDPVPQPRVVTGALEGAGGWRRDCVRWAFRLAELAALAGYDVLLDGAPLRLLLTHKFLVVADPDSERIVEMIDLRFCTLGPFQGSIVELIVTQRRQKEKVAEARLVDEDDEYQISAAAMARVARYTGAGGTAPAPSEARVLALLPPPRRAPSLHAALAAAIHHNADSHLHLL